MVNFGGGGGGLLNGGKPYILVGGLRLDTRIKFLPCVKWVKAWKVEVPNMFGTDITASFEPLYLPGTIFVTVSLLTFAIHRMTGAAYVRALKRSVTTMIAASAALVFTVPMVQVFIHSDGRAMG